MISCNLAITSKTVGYLLPRIRIGYTYIHTQLIAGILGNDSLCTYDSDCTNTYVFLCIECCMCMYFNGIDSCCSVPLGELANHKLCLYFSCTFYGNFVSCAAEASLISLDVEVFNYSYEHQCQLFDIYTFLVSAWCASAAVSYSKVVC